MVHSASHAMQLETAGRAAAYVDLRAQSSCKGIPRFDVRAGADEEAAAAAEPPPAAAAACSMARRSGAPLPSSCWAALAAEPAPAEHQTQASSCEGSVSEPWDDQGSIDEAYQTAKVGLGVGQAAG